MDEPGAPGLLIHLATADPVTVADALRYARNFLAECEGRPVEVLTNAAGLDLVMRDSADRVAVTDLAGTGTTTFLACANTMAGRAISSAELHPAARIVPAAVAHLARRQWAGWAYLRP